MDWTTILFTAGTVSVVVSGIVSGLVSWFAARHVAGRQERGRSAAQARVMVRDIVEAKLTLVRQYQARAMGSAGRLEEDGKTTFHPVDVQFCARVLNATADLPGWRRKLVTRRLRKLFGKNSVELCHIHGKQLDDPKMVTGVVLQRQAMGVMHPAEELPQPDRGSFDKALRCPPASKEVATLIRELERLSRAR